MSAALFPNLGSEPISVQFDTPCPTSEGGAALLALGYFDCNDSDRLRDDHLLRLLLGQDPDDGPGPAS